MEPIISEPMAITEPVVMKNGKKFNWRMSLVIVGTALAAAVISGGITWYVMNNKISDNNTSNSVQINKLQAQISGLKNTGVVSTTESASTSVASVNLTNDQIFQEVSTQLGLKRSSIGYFTIYSQDKVGYSYNNSDVSQFSGYAYKQSGKWNSVVVGQAVQGCSMYSSVPEQYKPVCMIENNNFVAADAHTAYLNSGEGSINYPTTSAVKYIGS